MGDDGGRRRGESCREHRAGAAAALSRAGFENPRLLAGVVEPDAGTVQRAAQLKVVQFEQERSALDPVATLRGSLAAHSDTVHCQGRPVHVAGWAKRFLFISEQLEQPVGRLSGGEQARVLLARLMLSPADVLLLDEPTNDLCPTSSFSEAALGDAFLDRCQGRAGAGTRPEIW